MEPSGNVALNKQRLIPVALYYGFMAALVNSILTIINHIAGTSDWSNITIGVIFYFALVVVCTVAQVYAVRIFRDEHLGGSIDFIKSFIICLFVCIVSYIIISILNYIFITYIDPDLIPRILQTIERTLEEKHVGPEQIDQALKIAARNVSPSAQFISVIINGTVWGIFTGLVVSLSLKKKLSY